jgi:tetratricopeptide (TPR) repeat protein
VDWKRVHETTIRGLDRLYSLEVDDALATFDTVSALAPGDPRGPFFHALTRFYLYGLNRSPADLEQFFSESDNVVEMCERLVDDNDRDAVARFYLGGILGYRGLAHQYDGSLLKAVKDGRRGYLLLDDAVHMDSTLYDAQMGFGLFRYLVAKVPRSMTWILNLLGFSGDLEGGLASLKLAADRGVYTRTEATLFLAQFLFNEGRQDTALQYLDRLIRRYPENTLFLVLSAAWQRQLNHPDEALFAAKKAVALNQRKKIRYGEELAFSTLGSVYFSLNEFSPAREYYLLYMKQTLNKERTPDYTYLRAGLACELAGDHDSAIRMFEQIPRVTDKDRARESYNYRRAQEMIPSPMSEADKLVIRAGNESSRKRLDTALVLYRRVLGETQLPVDTRLRALYGMQGTLIDAQRWEEVVSIGREIVQLTPVTEIWIRPHAQFRIGVAWTKLGNPAEARTAYEKVRQYDEYDFQDNLERRVDQELKKLSGAE